jgi:hypothetical protein
MSDGGERTTKNEVDPFRVDEVAAVQAGLLDYLKPDPVDIAIKIAALRATADLLQQAVTTAVIAQQFRSILDPRK